MKIRFISLYLGLVAAGALVATGVGIWALSQGYKKVGFNTLALAVTTLMLGLVGYISLRESQPLKRWLKEKHPTEESEKKTADRSGDNHLPGQ